MSNISLWLARFFGWNGNGGALLAQSELPSSAVAVVGVSASLATDTTGVANHQTYEVVRQLAELAAKFPRRSVAVVGDHVDLIVVRAVRRLHLEPQEIRHVHDMPVWQFVRESEPEKGLSIVVAAMPYADALLRYYDAHPQFDDIVRRYVSLVAFGDNRLFLVYPHPPRNV